VATAGTAAGRSSGGGGGGGGGGTYEEEYVVRCVSAMRVGAGGDEYQVC